MPDYTIQVIISADAQKLIGSLSKSEGQLDKFAKGTKTAATATSSFGKDLLKLGAAVGVGFGLAELTRGTVQFAKESLEASRAQAAARGALIATVGSAEAYEAAIAAARETTRGMISEAELASSTNVMLATGLADTAASAGQLAQEGAILTQVFSASGATVEKYVRLLQSGNLVLYDNFGLTQDMVNARKAEIVATGAAAGEEAKLQAIRELLHESATKYNETLDEGVVASAQLKAATTDLKAALGDALAPTVTVVAKELTTLFRAMADTSDIVAAQRQEIFNTSKSWEQYKAVMMATGYAVEMDRVEFEALKATYEENEHELRRLEMASQNYQATLKEETEEVEQAARQQTEAYEWSEYHRYEYYEALGDYYSDYLDEQESKAEEERALLEEQTEAYRASLESRAGYFLDLRELNDQSIQSEADYHASLGSLRADAAADQEAAQEGLNEKLVDLAQQREEKLHWVMTGAHARTAEENAAALAHWNAHYDQLEAEAKASYEEQNAAITAALNEREAAAVAAREAELAREQEAMERLKVQAALTVMETQGTLEQFTGGMATSASDAAMLIEAGVLPVTEEMAFHMQTLLQELATQNQATTEQATANAEILSQAIAGTLTEIAKPAIDATHQNYDNFSLVTFPHMSATHSQMAGTMISELGTVESTGTAAAEALGEGFVEAAEQIEDDVFPVFDTLLDYLDDIENAAEDAAKAMSDIPSAPAGAGGEEYQRGTGGVRMVPPGFNADNFMIGLTSGEQFAVAPRGRDLRDMLGAGRQVVNNYYFNQTVNTRATTGTVLQDYRMAQAILGIR